VVLLKTEDLSCVSDYFKNITCVWRSSTNYSGQLCELVDMNNHKRLVNFSFMSQIGQI